MIETLGKQLQMELAGQIVIPGHLSILPSGEIKQGMAEAVGNKAYNLSRVSHLSQAQVPAGFVVTIAGFRKYLAYNNCSTKSNLLTSCRRGSRLNRFPRRSAWISTGYSSGVAARHSQGRGKNSGIVAGDRPLLGSQQRSGRGW